MEQIKWKSKAAWTTMILSLVIILAFFFTQETVSMIEAILTAVLLAVEALGVFTAEGGKIVDRLKNPKVLGTLISSLMIILSFFLTEGAINTLDGILGALLAVLISFGIVNNPESKDTL